MEINSPSKTFHGVRFVLFGFDPLNERQVRSMLVTGGGVDVGQYCQNCTHVIVDNIVYDNPVCDAARNDGKTLVTGLWVDHSVDIGMPVDAASIMYRPRKDLNGIPGAQSLIICLTGYQRQDRDDIMTMVGLMGAQFSKPLVANKVTHLICYKFEGEKYELAKKMKKIKLINHRWLEDCLRDWELHPEANYNKSGHELEMMKAEAKDSEDEAENSPVNQPGVGNMTKSPHNLRHGTASPSSLPRSLGEVPALPPNSSVPGGQLNSGNAKGLLSTPDKRNMSDHASGLQRSPEVNVPEVQGCLEVGTCKAFATADLPDLQERTPIATRVNNDLKISSRHAESSPHSDAKFSAKSYSRKTPGRSMPSKEFGEIGSSKLHMGESNISDAFIFSSFKEEQRKDLTGANCVGSPQKRSELPHEEESTGKKRKTGVPSANFDLEKISHDGQTFIAVSPSVSYKIQGLEPASLLGPSEINNLSLGNGGHTVAEIADVSAAQIPGSRVSAVNSSSSNKKSSEHDLPFLKTVASETEQNANANEKTPQTFLGGSTESTLASKIEIKNSHVRRSAHLVGLEGEPQNHQHDVGVSYPCNRELEIDKSHNPSSLASLQGDDNSSAKPMKKKMVSKKTLGSRPKLCKTANQRRSICSNKTASESNPAISLSMEKEVEKIENFSDAMEVETTPPTRVEVVKGTAIKTVTKCGNESDSMMVSWDDETEAPEDKDEHEFGKAVDNKKFEAVKLLHEADTMVEKQLEVAQPVTNNAAVCMVDDAMALEEGNGGKEPQKVVFHKNLNSKSAVVKRNVNKGKKRTSGNTKIRTDPSVCETVVSKKAVDEERMENGKEIQGKLIEENCMQHPARKLQNRIVAGNKLDNSVEMEKENRPVTDEDQNSGQGKQHGGESASKSRKTPVKAKKMVSNSPLVGVASSQLRIEPVCFILSGHKFQRKEFQQVIRRLKGKFCRDSHQWSYLATHFIAPDPIRRTEKFFAAAASGRWILKTDYLAASNQAGRFLGEEPYEWHKNALSEDGAVNLEAPRKWRLLRERTGHGAFHGMRIVIYGECIAPPLDTLKRVVKSGDGNILATSPPYTRCLKSGVDFAVVSPGMPRVDLWIQEFLKHEIPCIVADYLVEYVCKPGYSLDKHVLYNTHAWAERSFNNLLSKAEEIAEDLTILDDCDNNDISCQICGSRGRGDVMLICGDESGSVGCGVGMHIDCCNPPLEEVPEEDWFCPKCSKTGNGIDTSKKSRKGTSVSKPI